MSTATSTDTKISEAIAARVSKRRENAEVKSREAELAKNRVSMAPPTNLVYG